MDNRVLRWFGTAASLVISIGLATLVIGRVPNAGLSVASSVWFVARGVGEMMFYLLPLWAADVLAYVVPAAMKWIRLVCGALGLGIGIAVIVGLTVARGGSEFLVAICCIYLALGAFNCWLSSLRATTEMRGACTHVALVVRQGWQRVRGHVGRIPGSGRSRMPASGRDAPSGSKPATWTSALASVRSTHCRHYQGCLREASQARSQWRVAGSRPRRSSRLYRSIPSGREPRRRSAEFGSVAKRPQAAEAPRWTRPRCQEAFQARQILALLIACPKSITEGLEIYVWTHGSGRPRPAANGRQQRLGSPHG